MTDLIIAIVGAVGAVVGALVSTLSAAAKNKMEAYRLWQWNRQLIDHIYRRAPPPPPEPPEDLFN